MSDIIIEEKTMLKELQEIVEIERSRRERLEREFRTFQDKREEERTRPLHERTAKSRRVVNEDADPQSDRDSDVLIDNYRRERQGGNEPTDLHKKLVLQDVPLLQIKEVFGITGRSTIQLFLSQVRDVIGNDEKACVSAAMLRMESDLRRHMGNEMDGNPNQTLGELQTILLRDFQPPENAQDAILKLIKQPYSFEENPREFAIRFRMQFRAICKAFPEKPIANGDVKWMRLVRKAMPEEVRQELEGLSGEADADLFLSSAEAEWERYHRQRGGVAAVQNKGSYRPRPLMNCGWCQNGSKHMRINCPRKTEPRSCFDCLKRESMRGHPGCPGRNAVPAGTPANNGEDTA